MASPLVGTWNLEKSENFEEYMKALGKIVMNGLLILERLIKKKGVFLFIGVGFATRKIGATVKPTVYISQNDGQWTIKVSSTFKSSEINFTDGVEFIEETLDGRKCKSTITSDGPSKLVQIQRDASSGDVASTITREVSIDVYVGTRCFIQV